MSERDWETFFGHAAATMEALNIPQQECDDVVAFVSSLKEDIVEMNQCISKKVADLLSIGFILRAYRGVN